MITMSTHGEYEQWKNDPVSQQEYKQYLLEELQKTEPISEPVAIYFTEQLTRNFNIIFKENK